ncbi:MAG: hypothetical protein D6718_11555 [Acidobacteria bacterium]|nr:MAG: hypothetical protein D6718_11555 [Acidobacteriota bacterium]
MAVSDPRWWWAALAAAAALGPGCSGGEGLEPPPREAVEELVLRALGPGRAEPPVSLLAVEEATPEGPVVREPRPEELAGLYLPPPLERVEVVSLECRRFPIWYVRLRAAGAEGPGARLVVEVAPLGRLGETPGPGASWRLLMRRWRAVPGPRGRPVPDFRPLAGEEEGATPRQVWIVVSPPWVPRGPRLD